MKNPIPYRSRENACACVPDALVGVPNGYKCDRRRGVTRSILEGRPRLIAGSAVNYHVSIVKAGRRPNFYGSLGLLRKRGHSREKRCDPLARQETDRYRRPNMWKVARNKICIQIGVYEENVLVSSLYDFAYLIEIVEHKALTDGGVHRADCAQPNSRLRLINEVKQPFPLFEVFPVTHLPQKARKLSCLRSCGYIPSGDCSNRPPDPLPVLGSVVPKGALRRLRADNVFKLDQQFFIRDPIHLSSPLLA
jgi:hypothetical protein